MAIVDKIFVAMMLMAVCTSSLACATSIAKLPITLRQTYGDGGYTEVSCASQPMRVEADDCYFRASDNREYRFNIAEAGYTDFIESYNYFEGSGQDFSISIEVSCQSEDLALVDGAQEANTRCRIYLVPRGKRLEPDVVDVLSVVGGKAQRRARKP